MTTAADIIARRLYDAGCRHAFGIPGGEVLTVMQALSSAGVEFVLTKHENCAGFMAEGTFHSSGAPGVLVATLGPGVANAATVIANAMQDRVPLIVLTGCVDPVDALTYTHQVFDHRALLGPITKASFTVVDGAVDVTIDKAVAIALDDQPGPVHVDVPVGIAARPEPEVPAIRRVRPAPAAPAAGPDLEAAQRHLRDSVRPLMIAGVDVLHHDATAAVASLAQDFGIPVITTYKAKGVLSEDHPLALGAAGLSPTADKFLLPLVKQSDFILLVGYDPIEMRMGWRDPWDRHTPVVEFSSVPNTHYVHQASISFVGHVGAGIKALRADLEPRQATWASDEPAAVRAALRSAFRPDEEWGPAAVVDTIRGIFPRNGIATVDSGAHRILLSQVWQCYEPRTLLQSDALGAMGSALPLAMGFKLAERQRPVIAFTGDAGLEMVLGELATLRDLRLGIVIVVFVDEQLGLIEIKQRGAGYQNLAVDFGATDFPAVAVALGGYGALVRNRDDLAREFETALGRSTFTVIACAIGRRTYDGRL
ncbi:MAG: thiamine pyrophosphate-binding protein [Acidiferrobacterales bacterium]